MTLLGSNAIAHGIQEGLIICDPAPHHVEGVHIDIRLGPWFWLPRPNIAAKPLDLTSADPRDLYELHHASEYGMRVYIPPAPTMILAHTIEYIGTSVPELQPDLDGRSTAVRWGLTAHVSAGHGDPGYCTRWTLEILNMHAVAKFLPVGARIGSIRFTRVDDNAQLYTARYNVKKSAWKPEDMLPRIGNW